jgi:NADPH-dependent ferric siderophore reductase
VTDDVDVPAVPTRLVMHDLEPRVATVRAVERITPLMARVTLADPSLATLPGGAATDHVKLVFPPHGQEEPVMPALGPRGLVPSPTGVERRYRDYTVRRHDPAGELVIDMVVHPHGIAGSWAERAEPGQRLGVLGPRGSHLVAPDLPWYLFAGDETALPAIARWVEELPASARAIVLLEVADAAEEQPLPSAARVEPTWLHRDGAPAGSTDLLARAVAGADLPDGPGFAFVAGEAGCVRPVRRHLRTDRGLARERVDVDGYWRRGVVDHDHHAVDDVD